MKLTADKRAAGFVRTFDASEEYFAQRAGEPSVYLYEWVQHHRPDIYSRLELMAPLDCGTVDGFESALSGWMAAFREATDLYLAAGGLRTGCLPAFMIAFLAEGNSRYADAARVAEKKLGAFIRSEVPDGFDYLRFWRYFETSHQNVYAKLLEVEAGMKTVLEAGKVTAAGTKSFDAGLAQFIETFKWAVVQYRTNAPRAEEVAA